MYIFQDHCFIQKVNKLAAVPKPWDAFQDQKTPQRADAKSRHGATVVPALLGHCEEPLGARPKFGHAPKGAESFFRAGAVHLANAFMAQCLTNCGRSSAPTSKIATAANRNEIN